MGKKYLFKKLYLLIIVLLIYLISLNCVKNLIDSNGDGTGTIIGNGIISATILTENGEPLQCASVHIRNFDYTAGDYHGSNYTTKIDTVTDLDGKFTIMLLDTGLFCIEVVKNDTLGKLLLCSLNRQTPYKVFDTLNALPYGQINGRLDGSDKYS